MWRPSFWQERTSVAHYLIFDFSAPRVWGFADQSREVMAFGEVMRSLPKGAQLWATGVNRRLGPLPCTTANPKPSARPARSTAGAGATAARGRFAGEPDERDGA